MNCGRICSGSFAQCHSRVSVFRSPVSVRPKRQHNVVCMAGKVLLEVKGLTANVAATGESILKGVDLTVCEGEIHAIMGQVKCIDLCLYFVDFYILVWRFHGYDIQCKCALFFLQPDPYCKHDNNFNIFDQTCMHVLLLQVFP